MVGVKLHLCDEKHESNLGEVIDMKILSLLLLQARWLSDDGKSMYIRYCFTASDYVGLVIRPL